MMLIKDLPVKFNPSGGSAFLYSTDKKVDQNEKNFDKLMLLLNDGSILYLQNKENVFVFIRTKQNSTNWARIRMRIMALSAEPGLAGVPLSPAATLSITGREH